MSRIVTNETHYSSIASAIRQKLSVSTAYKPSEMAPAILEIEQGMHHIAVSPFSVSENGVYSAEGDTAFDPIDVNVDKQVEFIPAVFTSNGVYYPTAQVHPYAAFNPVTVSLDITEYSMSSAAFEANGVYAPPAGYLYDQIFADVPGYDTLVSSVISGAMSFIEVAAPERALFSTVTVNLYSSVTSFVNKLIEGEIMEDSECQFLFNSALTYIRPYAFCKSSHAANSLSVSFTNVTEIGQYAFCNLDTLQTAAFPACVYINDGAFQGCTGLVSASLPVCDAVGACAFQDCSTLTSLTLPACTSVGASAFYRCESLQSVSLPACMYLYGTVFNGAPISSFYFPAVFALHGTFADNQNITAISLPSCQMIGEGAFVACINLRTVDAPAAAIIQHAAFMSCSAMQSISFPACTRIGSAAFKDCFGLSTVDLGACRNVGEAAFENCSNLSIIEMSALVSVESHAFMNCGNLRTVSFRNCGFILQMAFASCSNLMSVYLLGSSVVSIEYDIFTGTPIKQETATGDYGSIYVPASLVSDYLADWVWEYYSDRIVAYDD